MLAVDKAVRVTVRVVMVVGVRPVVRVVMDQAATVAVTRAAQRLVVEDCGIHVPEATPPLRSKKRAGRRIPSGRQKHP